MLRGNCCCGVKTLASILTQSGVCVCVCVSVCLCLGHNDEPCKATKPIGMMFEDRVAWLNEPCISSGTRRNRRHLANTIKRSVMGDDAGCR